MSSYSMNKFLFWTSLLACSSLLFMACDHSSKSSTELPPSGSPKASTAKPTKPAIQPTAQLNMGGFYPGTYLIDNASCVANALSFNDESTASGKDLSFTGMDQESLNYNFAIDFQDNTMSWDDIPASLGIAQDPTKIQCVITESSHITFKAPTTAGGGVGTIHISDIYDTSYGPGCTPDAINGLADVSSSFLIGQDIPYTVAQDNTLQSVGLFNNVSDACMGAGVNGMDFSGVQFNVEGPYGD